MPDERDMLLMALRLAQGKAVPANGRGDEPLQMAEWQLRNLPPAWPAAGTLPPGHPRAFRNAAGHVFAREEGGAVPMLDDDSSPSDRPPLAFAPGMDEGPLEAPPAAQPRGVDDAVAQQARRAQADVTPLRGPTVTMGGAWPIRQAMMAMNTEREPTGHGEHAEAMRGDQARLRQIIDAKAHPQAYGPEGMRPSFARMLKESEPSSNLPAGLLDVRLKYLGQKPTSGQPAQPLSKSENDKVLAAIRAESVAKEPTLSPREAVHKGWVEKLKGAATLDGDTIRLRYPNGQTAEFADEEEANKAIDDFAQQKAEAWQGTMAQGEARDRQSLASRPQAFNRLAEAELFKKSPRAWYMLKMAGGGLESKTPPFGGGFGGLAVAAHMMGDSEGAQLARMLGKDQAEALHGAGLLGMQREQGQAELEQKSSHLDLERQMKLAELAQAKVAASQGKISYDTAKKQVLEENPFLGQRVGAGVPAGVPAGAPAGAGGQGGAVPGVPRADGQARAITGAQSAMADSVMDSLGKVTPPGWVGRAFERANTNELMDWFRDQRENLSKFTPELLDSFLTDGPRRTGRQLSREELIKTAVQHLFTDFTVGDMTDKARHDRNTIKILRALRVPDYAVPKVVREGTAGFGRQFDISEPGKKYWENVLGGVPKLPDWNGSKAPAPAAPKAPAGNGNLPPAPQPPRRGKGEASYKPRNLMERFLAEFQQGVA